MVTVDNLDKLTLSELSALMVGEEINVLDMTDSYILYEFSYITSDGRMKKWAKRLAPLTDSIPVTYRQLISQVRQEREQLGQ